MDVRIGDTLEHLNEWGKTTSHTILNELDRQQAIGALRLGVGFKLIAGSFLADRSNFGPTSDAYGRMFEGNVN